ncbi:DUF3265 domain-containing protein [Vibrio parahaemolyticus]|nr:DUF3265 domain-containing protein [Vibrio parahaemolyticus]MCI9710167.1 DUF3265 domain-containing protein [Vibrio parahaemolyticus]MCI9715246.1 DUF3265 domain-containing protein [Vibrio parahaemolyticus]MCR9722531.1 DUF3265 domain-containing protein [Vibrio parahaemolyticus]MCR9947777.1 DUF3265 domain-containing protein [Vibrio parahaemolyticus]
MHPKYITNCSRGIRNAWQFWFAVSFVFTAQSGKVGSALLTT